jgi:hypothetical protein
LSGARAKKLAVRFKETRLFHSRETSKNSSIVFVLACLALNVLGRSQTDRRIATTLSYSALILVPAEAAASALLLNTAPLSIEVRGQPIAAFDRHEPSRQRFGQLEFRGGMALTSSYREFGGFSAIRMAADGAHFISLSDHGRWFQGRITYEEERPVGISEAVMAPILGPDGQALAAHGWHDESIADDDDTLYVGIEGANQIVRFDYGKNGLQARGHAIPVPAGIHMLPKNKGLEALVFVPRSHAMGGTLIAISKRGLDHAGNLQAFGGPAPGSFSIKRTEQFDISDAASFPTAMTVGGAKEGFDVLDSTQPNRASAAERKKSPRM